MFHLNYIVSFGPSTQKYYKKLQIALLLKEITGKSNNMRQQLCVQLPVFSPLVASLSELLSASSDSHWKDRGSSRPWLNNILNQASCPPTPPYLYYKLPGVWPHRGATEQPREMILADGKSISVEQQRTHTDTQKHLNMKWLILLKLWNSG